MEKTIRGSPIIQCESNFERQTTGLIRKLQRLVLEIATSSKQTPNSILIHTPRPFFESPPAHSSSKQISQGHMLRLEILSP
jgi:hypothetical protein